MDNMCPECGYTNRSGMLFCDNCGLSLVEQDGIPTKKLPEERDRRSSKTPIMIHVRDTTQPIIIHPAPRVVLGRIEPSGSLEGPDVDLTPYGAPEMGVSRIHAALTNDEDKLSLVDMGSSNGTFLNGQRLFPNQALPVHDGDEIRLGRLVAHIHLK